MSILHGVNLSPFVRKVRFALAEKGITVEQNQIVPFGAPDSFKKLSPLGKIPVWEDGDLVLPDSSVIIDYLEHVHPEPALYPTEPGQRGRALFYEEYGDTKVTPTLSTVFFQRFVRKNFFKEEPDEAVIAASLTEELPGVLDYLAGELGDNDYLVGNRFSIADIAVSTAFVNFRLGGESVDAARWPTIAAYVDRVFSRPAIKPLVEADVSG
jgi:glutathione S-transferase